MEINVDPIVVEPFETNEVMLNEKQLRYCITQIELAEVLAITTSYIGTWAKSKKQPVIRQKKHTLLPSSTVRNFLLHRNYQYPKKVLAFQMLKGGSTKTTSAFNLAVRLNHYGARVLCVDLDPQGNLTTSFDVDTSDKNVFINVVEDNIPIDDVIVNVSEGLDLLPSDFNNASIDLIISKESANPATFIEDYISEVEDRYDFVIFDCNPSLSPLNTSIALASDQVVIPVNPDRYSKSGLEKTLEQLGRLGKSYRKEIPYSLLFTRYDARTATSQNYLVDFGSTYRDHMFKTVIRNTNDVQSAIHNKQTVFQLKSSYAKEDYDLLALEMLGLRKEEPQGRV